MKALLTAGIGDMIAVDGLLTVEERHAVEEIYWCTPHHEVLSNLAPIVYPNLHREHVINIDWQEIRIKKRSHKDLISEHTDVDISACLNYCALPLYQEVLAGKRCYRGSRIATTRLADLKRFKLPERYVVIHPYSINAPKMERNFRQRDWKVLIPWLEAKSLPAYVLGVGGKPKPKHELIHNLTNGTTLMEALAITQNCYAFIGCGSCLSVMASRVLPEKRICVKTTKTLLKEWAKSYYLPHVKRDFLSHGIPKRLLEMEV